MSFLNPSWLWALPVAAAPLLLHLIFLSRARLVPFSDLTLLRAAYAKSLPSTRLRQWLLLLLRTLVLAGIVVAFCRPVLHRGRSGEESLAGPRSEQGLDVVVLVDDSWSMGALVRGKPRFEWACAAGRELIGLLRPADRVAVAAFSDRLEGELLWAESRAAAAETLQGFRLGNRPSDISGPLAGAYAFLAADKAPRKRIVAVLSDNARHLLRGIPEEDPARLPGHDPEIRLLGLAWDDPVDNAGIAELGLAGEPGPGGEPVLGARVSLSGAARRDWQASLWVGSKRVDSRSLDLRPGVVSAGLYPLPPSSGPEIWGRLSLRSDRLAADDDFYYAMRVHPKPRVLLAYGSPSYLEAGRAGYFFRRLLEGGRELPYVFDMVELGRVERLRLEDFDVLMLDEVRTLPPAAAEAVKRFVLRGGGLWVLAGTRAAADAFKPLQDVLPASLGPMGSYHGGASSLVPGKDLPDRGRFSWADFELRNVSLGRRYDAELRPGSGVWFRDSAGAPLMSCGTFGHGRVLLYASAVDVSWSNLALKPVFTAWTDTALRHLSRTSDQAEWRALKVGEPLVRRWEPEEAAPARVQVRAPGGRSAVLLVEDRRISFPDTRDPGLYFVQALSGSETTSVEAYAANLDRSGAEGDWTPPRKTPWTLLGTDSLREDFLRSVYGKEVRTLLLGLVGLLLVLETLLARPRVVGALLLALSLPSVCLGQDGDKLVWSQVRYTGAWDPYPGAYRDVLDFVASVTSVLVHAERREVSLADPGIFGVPFLVLSGKQAPPDLSETEVARLRDYLSSGGFLWIDDASGVAASPFDRWVRRSLAAALPDSELRPLPPDHVVLKTFFLMRKPGGRVLVSGAAEGVDWGGKTVVVYTRNDLLGAWAKDPLGRHLHECAPGGEAQRMQARKMTLNIVMFALTGTYKADAVHQPYILEKMRMGQP